MKRIFKTVKKHFIYGCGLGLVLTAGLLTACGNQEAKEDKKEEAKAEATEDVISDNVENNVYERGYIVQVNGNQIEVNTTEEEMGIVGARYIAEDDVDSARYLEEDEEQNQSENEDYEETDESQTEEESSELKTYTIDENTDIYLMAEDGMAQIQPEDITSGCAVEIFSDGERVISVTVWENE